MTMPRELYACLVIFAFACGYAVGEAVQHFRISGQTRVLGLMKPAAGTKNIEIPISKSFEIIDTAFDDVQKRLEKLENPE